MKYQNIESVREMNAFQIGALVDVSPDGAEGESFLTSVRDSVLEATENYEPEDWEREILEDYSGRATEIADGAPCVYTWRKWHQFLDLSGWLEDISDYEIGDDLEGYHGVMDAGATCALYSIARRLVSAIAEEIAPEDNDDD